MNKINFKKFNRFIYVVIALICFLILSFGFNDTDLYYIIPTGKHLLNNIGNEKIFPNLLTPISTIKQTLVIQNWLYCIFIYLINKYLHTFGLWLLQVVFITISTICILKFLNFKKSKNKLTCLYIALGIMFIFSYVNLRPQMLTFILIMSEIFIIENFRKTNNSKILWLMLIPIWLEINCHASYWIMHFIVLLPYIVPIPKKIQNKLKLNIINNNLKLNQIKKLILPCIGMFLVLFLNPYKIEGILYVFKSLTDSSLKILSISELQPFVVTNIHTWLIFISILALIICIKKGKIKSVSLWMFIGFTILVIGKAKWMPFFTLGLLYIVRDIFTYWENRKVYKAQNDTEYGNVSKFSLVGLFIFLIVFTLTYFISNYKDGMFSISNNEFLKTDKTMVMVSGDLNDIGKYLDEQNKPAYIYTYFEIGNYFEFLGYETNMDARPELYMNTNINNYKESLKAPVTEAPLIKCSKILYGIDYSKNIKALEPQKGEKISVSDMILSYDEYSKEVDSIDTDYFVTIPDNILLNHYLESNPDKYEYIMGKEYALYKKIK